MTLSINNLLHRVPIPFAFDDEYIVCSRIVAMGLLLLVQLRQHHMLIKQLFPKFMNNKLSNCIIHNVFSPIGISCVISTGYTE